MTNRLSHEHALRLTALAKRQAMQLRSEAIDDFWRGADALLQRSAHSAGRSLERLLYSLERHAQARAQQRLGSFKL